MPKQTKLTLRLERDLIERAKKIARLRGKSVSRMVADYFRALDTVHKEDQDVAPLTRSLQGILRDSSLGERDHQRHLEDRHGR
jgi:hypothetical protein